VIKWPVKLRTFFTFFTFFQNPKTWLFTFFWVADHVFSNTGWKAVWGVIFKICVIFGVRFERRKVDKKRKPTQKLMHADFILEYFEYPCQMSSKSILIILSTINIVVVIIIIIIRPISFQSLCVFFWDTVY